MTNPSVNPPSARRQTKSARRCLVTPRLAGACSKCHKPMQPVAHINEAGYFCAGCCPECRRAVTA